MANGRQRPVNPHEITIVELAARFWQHAETYYRKPNGTPTSTFHNYQATLRPLKRLYGPSRDADFSPRSLKAIRQELIAAGWTRGVVNQAVNLVRGVFRWGVVEGLIPVATHTALTAVQPLRGADAKRGNPNPRNQSHLNTSPPFIRTFPGRCGR